MARAHRYPLGALSVGCDLRRFETLWTPRTSRLWYRRRAAEPADIRPGLAATVLERVAAWRPRAVEAEAARLELVASATFIWDS